MSCSISYRQVDQFGAALVSRRPAAFIIAALEGAVIMCRAERSTAPMEANAVEIHDLPAHALRNRPDQGQARRP
ncbi:hypothetical protein [Streptomyces sp. NPDC058545]|uniref:LmrA/YxaF family transcription factor n=1 Tax=Streptomyces sp. NPDC058545 TaxID=3346544 RepID=UPI003659A471